MSSEVNRTIEMPGSGKSRGLLKVNLSSKLIKPANVVPNHEDNPVIFVGVAESSSKIDNGVDDGDEVGVDVMINDVEIIVGESPTCHQHPDAVKHTP